MSVIQHNLEKVATLYDSPEGQLGPILFGGHMHWGYWDDSNRDEDFVSGANKLAEIMINKVQIQPNQRFIDIGCGVGLSGMKLAQIKNCHVEGITISSVQQQSAMATAKTESLLKQVNFICGDACNLPYADCSFDGGWFFESIFHMGHRRALNEAHRVLKKNSILTLTDLPILSHTTNNFKEFVEKHIHANFISKESYSDLLDEAGFKLLEIDDITDKVMPYLVQKLSLTIEKNKDQIYMKISNPEKTTDNWLYLFEYMSLNLGYIIVTAQRL